MLSCVCDIPLSVIYSILCGIDDLLRYVLSCVCERSRTVVCAILCVVEITYSYSEIVIHVVAEAGFLSRFLNGSLP